MTLTKKFILLALMGALVNGVLFAGVGYLGYVAVKWVIAEAKK